MNPRRVIDGSFEALIRDDQLWHYAEIRGVFPDMSKPMSDWPVEVLRRVALLGVPDSRDAAKFWEIWNSRADAAIEILAFIRERERERQGNPIRELLTSGFRLGCASKLRDQRGNLLSVTRFADKQVAEILLELAGQSPRSGKSSRSL